MSSPLLFSYCSYFDSNPCFLDCFLSPWSFSEHTTSLLTSAQWPRDIKRHSSRSIFPQNACNRTRNGWRDMRHIFWWIFHIFGLLICTGFLVLGINMLWGAYGMRSPLNFFIAFFGSSMMILISGSLILGISIRIILRWRGFFNNQVSQG